MDALYFRVSSDRQTTENQFDELITAAGRAGDPGREWDRIRSELARAVVAETRTTRRGITRTVYRVDEAIARRLAHQCIYVEQGKSGKAGRRRPLFDHGGLPPSGCPPDIAVRSAPEQCRPSPATGMTAGVGPSETERSKFPSAQPVLPRI